MSSSIILVAPAAALAILRAQPYFRDARAFTDSEIDQAIRTIHELLPPVIVLERSFAASLPGQGFVERLRSDAILRTCAVETVGIRRAERRRLLPSVDVAIDEKPATLIDISTTGALVVSAWSLRPRQRIRVVLRAGDRPVTALVVWAHFELPNEGPRYRAGVEFVTSATEVVERFISEAIR